MKQQHNVPLTSDDDDDDDSSQTYYDWIWIAALALYMASFVGDLFDGMVARKLQQTSSFGGVLDMITDRCSTLGFLFILSEEYRPLDEQHIIMMTTQQQQQLQKWQWQRPPPLPLFRILFLSLILLDISSHWCQMYASLACSSSDGVAQHHKSEQGNKGRNFLVQWFYKYYWFFGYLCVGAEFTYILLYALRHVQQDDDDSLVGGVGVVRLVDIIHVLLAFCVPGCIAKQVVNVAQLCSACHTIAAWDAQQRNDKNKRSKKDP